MCIYETTARPEMDALVEHQFPRAPHRYENQPWESRYDPRYPLRLFAAQFASMQEQQQGMLASDEVYWAALRDRQRGALANSALGEKALAVYIAHSTPSEQIYRDICRLRTYIPGAVKTEFDFQTQQTAISKLERELCDVPRRRRMLASVSRDTRRTQLECTPKSTAFGPKQPSWAVIFDRETAITTQLQRLMCAMVKYGCGDDTIDVERNNVHYHAMVNRHKHFGGDKSKIVMPQTTCHEWRSYWTTDNPLQRTLDIITSLWQGLRIYRGELNEDGNSRYPRVCYSVRDLLAIIDVVPHLTLSVDHRHRQQLTLQCERIAQLTRDYYDSVISLLDQTLDSFGNPRKPFSVIDNFMHQCNGIVIDRAIFDMD